MDESRFNVKQFLHSWLGKNKHEAPNYNVRSTGPKHRRRFLCELRVHGYDYVATGNSTNKKNAQANSAKDFISYLVISGHMDNSEVPDAAGVPNINPTGLFSAYEKPGQEPGLGNFKRDYLEKLQSMDKKKMEEVEDVDVNSVIHGNWTMEVAKSKLHQIIQERNIKTDYKYIKVGSAHNKSFDAEMDFYVKELKRKIRAHEAGGTKRQASKAVALSLVRQLFHLGVIPAYGGTLKKNKDVESLKPYDARRHNMERVGTGGFQSRRRPRSFEDDDGPPAKRGPRVQFHVR